ncbi:unnamed protein product [Sphagnum tenellum]
MEGESNDAPSEARLSVYRQAFSYFMEDFTTYKPFLLSVQRDREGPNRKGTPSETQEAERQVVEREISAIKESQGLAHSKEQESQRIILELQKQLERESIKYRDMTEINRSLIATTKRSEEELLVSQREHAAQEENSAARERLLVAKAEQLEKRLKKIQLEMAQGSKQPNNSSDPSIMEEAIRASEEKYRGIIEKLKADNSSYISTIAELTASRENAVSIVEFARKSILQTLFEDGEKTIKPNASLKELLEIINMEMRMLRTLKVTAVKMGTKKSLVMTGTPITETNPHSGSSVSFAAHKKSSLSLKTKKPSSNVLSTLAYQPANGVYISSYQKAKTDLTYVPKTTTDFFTGKGTGPDIPDYLKISGVVPNWRLSKRTTESEFCETLRGQYLKEIVDFRDKVKQAVTANGFSRNNEYHINVTEARDALVNVDPFISSEQLDALLCRGFDCEGLEDLDKNPSRNVDEVLKSLLSKLLKPSNPK